MIETERIYLRSITLNDDEFIFKLVNTPDWLEFIGNRNVNTLTDAKVFIQQALDSPIKDYYPIILKESDTPIGMLSFIHRGHEEHPDFGFAMLPEFTRKGYCFEASTALLTKIHKNHPTILGIAKYNNQNSIGLLQKLGFRFLKQEERETLMNYYVLNDG